MIGLFAAIECGDTKKVEHLFSQLAPEDIPKMLDYRNRTAMHLAVEHGHDDVVDVLLNHSGIINLAAIDGGGFTALHLAAELGHDKIVAKLLQKSPELAHGKTRTGLSCLHLAAIRGQVAVVQVLLAIANFLVPVQDDKRRLALHFAVEYGHKKIVEMFMESAKSEWSFRKSMFHAAIRSGHDAIASELLAQDPNLIDAVDYSYSPLHLAANYGREAIVAQIFAQRTPRLAPVGGRYGMSPLHFASQYGYDAVVAELLVEQPHLIDVPNENERSVLHLAARGGHDTIVQQLLAHRPQLIESKDSFGGTVLHSAAGGGHEKVMERLFALKPDLISAVDKNGHTVLDLACCHVQPKAVAWLLAHGADVCNKAWARASLRSGLGDSRICEMLRLLAAHKPDLMASVDYRKNTMLHEVFGVQFEEPVFFQRRNYADRVATESSRGVACTEHFRVCRAHPIPRCHSN